ncbi:iojap-like protein [Prevotella sp. CAG:755]|mgnify:CR=1 FL=1|nr:iojap-like protein [Prevotella sp. CAG:755]
MEKQSALVQAIIEGIQEKKGSHIVIADLTSIPTAPCQHFIICQGNSPQQVEAITRAVEESARTKAHEKPAAVVGRTNAQWVAMDYGTDLVHIFLPDVRDYYDLEHLWEDAEITAVPDVE